MARKRKGAKPPTGEVGGDTSQATTEFPCEREYAEWLVDRATNADREHRFDYALEALDSIASSLIAGEQVQYALALHLCQAVDAMKRAGNRGMPKPEGEFLEALGLVRAEGRPKSSELSADVRLAMALLYAERHGLQRCKRELTYALGFSASTADRASRVEINQSLSDDDLLHNLAEMRQELLQFVKRFK